MVRFPRVKFNFVDMCWSRQSGIKLPPFYTLPPLIEPKTVLGFWWYHTSDALWSVFWSHKSVSYILYPSPVPQPPCLCSDFLYLRFGLCADSCFISSHSIHLPDCQGLLFYGMNALLSNLKLTFHNQCKDRVGWWRNLSCNSNNHPPSTCCMSSIMFFTIYYLIWAL